MQDYLQRATQRKIDRLSQLVTESFRYLLHKQALGERVQIDPDSFAITLYDRTGRAIPKQRLSEGEKQIFAVVGPLGFVAGHRATAAGDYRHANGDCR